MSNECSISLPQLCKKYMGKCETTTSMNLILPQCKDVRLMGEYSLDVYCVKLIAKAADMRWSDSFNIARMSLSN